LDELRANINNKTRVLILNTPHNPTGKVGASARGALSPRAN
jgi:aspartate/methionine/tyrosine aminotransferase